MLLDRGYVTLGRYRGTPIRLHWTLVIGMLFVSGMRFAPGAWGGYILLILLHEMGHAFLARRYGLAVREIMIHGMGGHCAYAGYPTLYQQAVIATGGVVAQFFLLLIAAPIAAFVPMPSVHLADMLGVLTYTNVMLILFNLIPVQPLDGHLILQLPGLYAKAERERLLRAHERAESERERQMIINRARGKASGIEPVDERAVKDLVQRALEDARRAAKDRQN